MAGKILILLVILCFSARGVLAQDAPLKRAAFIPQWVPQAQFAGFCVAHEKGFYRQAGIDLEMIPGGPRTLPDKLLLSGRAQFATLWLASGIQLRSHGASLVNIGQMVQRSALMLVAKKSSGIVRPEHMDGKRVGLWEDIFQVQPRAFFKKFGVNVQVIPQTYSVNLFLRGGVDVASAMWYNEYHTILNCGLNSEEISSFFFQDYDLSFPEDGIYVMEETLDRDPDLCRAFVRASVKGWEYAFAHPEEALGIVMGRLRGAHLPASMVHQRWMLARMKDIMVPSGLTSPMGRLAHEDYDRVTKVLMEAGLITKIPPLRGFYRDLNPADSR